MQPSTQQPAGPPADDATADTARRLEQRLHAWSEAIVSNDPARIDEFITDDWVLVNPEAGVFERRWFLELVAQGTLTHDKMDHHVIRTAIYGTTAVVTTRARSAGTYLGERIEADEWTTDVFVHDGDDWLCVLTQLTPVPQAAVPPA